MGGLMESLKEMILTGKQHFENHQYGQAEEIFRQVIDRNPGFADVHNMLGVIAHAEGKFASAIDHFEKAIEINPRYTEATLNLAVLYNDLGQYEKSKALYKRLTPRTNKGDTHVEPVLRGKLSNLHADIGDIYRSIGLYGHAIGEYRKALDLNPHYLDIRTKLGQALREHGFHQDSLLELRNVLKSKAAYSPALIQLGITYYAMNNAPEAMKVWRQALSKDPENQHARMYLRLCEAALASAPKPAKKAAEKPVKSKSKSKVASRTTKKK